MSNGARWVLLRKIKPPSKQLAAPTVQGEQCVLRHKFAGVIRCMAAAWMWMMMMMTMVSWRQRRLIQSEAEMARVAQRKVLLARLNGFRCRVIPITHSLSQPQVRLHDAHISVLTSVPCSRAHTHTQPICQLIGFCLHFDVVQNFDDDFINSLNCMRCVSVNDSHESTCPSMDSNAKRSAAQIKCGESVEIDSQINIAQATSQICLPLTVLAQSSSKLRSDLNRIPSDARNKKPKNYFFRFRNTWKTDA